MQFRHHPRASKRTWHTIFAWLPHTTYRGDGSSITVWLEPMLRRWEGSDGFGVWTYCRTTKAIAYDIDRGI